MLQSIDRISRIALQVCLKVIDFFRSHMILADLSSPISRISQHPGQSQAHDIVKGSELVEMVFLRIVFGTAVALQAQFVVFEDDERYDRRACIASTDTGTRYPMPNGAGRPS